jgi:hypothetical protein
MGKGKGTMISFRRRHDQHRQKRAERTEADRLYFRQFEEASQVELERREPTRLTAPAHEVIRQQQQPKARR